MYMDVRPTGYALEAIGLSISRLVPLTVVCRRCGASWRPVQLPNGELSWRSCLCLKRCNQALLISESRKPRKR